MLVKSFVVSLLMGAEMPGPYLLLVGLSSILVFLVVKKHCRS